MGVLILLNWAIEAFLIVLLIRYVISWLAPYTRNSFTEAVYGITDPVVKRCRVVIPVGRGYMDLSYIVIYFVAKLLKRIIFYIYYSM